MLSLHLNRLITKNQKMISTIIKTNQNKIHPPSSSNSNPNSKINTNSSRNRSNIRKSHSNNSKKVYSNIDRFSLVTRLRISKRSMISRGRKISNILNHHNSNMKRRRSRISHANENLLYARRMTRSNISLKTNSSRIKHKIIASIRMPLSSRFRVGLWKARINLSSKKSTNPKL